MGPHLRESVKKHDIHIKPKSYELELLGELIVQHISIEPNIKGYAKEYMLHTKSIEAKQTTIKWLFN